MALSVLKEIRKIYAAVNADEIRQTANRNLTVGLMAADHDGFQAMEHLLAPPSLPDAVRNDVLGKVERVNGQPLEKYSLVLCETGTALPPNGYRFDAARPLQTVHDIVAGHEDLELALARNFPQFRKPVADRIVHRISRDNALFSLVTALPNVVPTLIDLPWAIGEFATDTAFLTMNQVRMALLMAAAHNRPIGYGEQKMEIAAIAGGAFGWRALARELVGKIPLGGGLIPKAAIAYAGTYVVGMGLERINRNGEGLSKWEKREVYVAALARGKEVVREFAPSLSKRNKG